MAKVTIPQILEALKASAGFYGIASQKLGISRQALWRRVRDNPELQECVDDLKELQLDLTESKLLQAIKGGEGWAICFHLKTKGKSRGYIESQHVHLDGGLTLGVAECKDRAIEARERLAEIRSERQQLALSEGAIEAELVQ